MVFVNISHQLQNLRLTVSPFKSNGKFAEGRSKHITFMLLDFVFISIDVCTATFFCSVMFAKMFGVIRNCTKTWGRAVRSISQIWHLSRHVCNAFELSLPLDGKGLIQTPRPRHLPSPQSASEFHWFLEETPMRFVPPCSNSHVYSKCKLLWFAVHEDPLLVY